MKRIHLILTCIALLIPMAVRTAAQSGGSVPLPASCNCADALEQTIDKVTRIYAGFDDKVTSTTRPAYDRLVKELRTKAPGMKTESACKQLLDKYADFFNDSHVFIIKQQKSHIGVSNMDANRSRIDLVEFRQLDNDYIYLKLKAFDQREVDKLDSLLIANKTLLAKTPFLIFDLRGNGGGNTSTSDEMAKLIYTNTFVYPAWDYRSSPERIAARERDLKAQKDTTNPYYARDKKVLAEMKQNPGKMVRDGEDLQRPYDLDPNANPRHIAFLIDKNCGSATEFFVFEGKQSKKVTLFGENTHGVMDYGSDQNFYLCDSTFSLAVPWGRNGWVRKFRIDKVGFAPDVRIPKSEKDWIGFVKRYYREKKGIREEGRGN